MVDSTINLIKIDQLNSQHEFNYIEQRINAILTKMNQIDKEEAQQWIFEIVTTLSFQLLSKRATLHRIEITILNRILTNFHQGTLSLLLLSPQ